MISGPDVSINCSGIYGPHGPAECVPGEEWVKTIQVNLIGAYYLTKAAVYRMVAKGGKIIHFSGGGAANARPFYTAYASSKAGLVRFVESVAGENPNIQINAIAPGSVKSRLNPEGTGTPDRAADLALFLATDETGITGRLISAIHDDWEHLDGKNMMEDDGTLRRMPFKGYLT